jgi:hypothetical protein
MGAILAGRAGSGWAGAIGGGGWGESQPIAIMEANNSVRRHAIFFISLSLGICENAVAAGGLAASKRAFGETPGRLKWFRNQY